MTEKVSFDELKALVSITDCAAWCGVKVKPTGKTFRGDCQLCGEERSFTLTPERGLWGCFKCQKRGSIIDMVLHFKQTANVRDAALMIQQHFLGDGTVPSREDSPPPGGNSSLTITEKRREDGEPLKPLDYLTTDHEAIEALGLSAAACNALGIGYAPKGTMRGRVVFPMRTVDGKLCGYAGLATKADMAPLMMIPKNLDQMLAAPAEETKQAAGDDVRQFLRVVK